MRIVIQRVKEASVLINGHCHSQIAQGLLLLIGVEQEDTPEDADWLASKVVGMRIFSDREGKMNLNLSQAGGEILAVSQFTLHANTKKGNRPSFIRAAQPEKARELYAYLCRILSVQTQCTVREGVFGADMQVALINDGPVTIVMDSKNKSL